jgi:hypothetical protein
VNETMHAPTGLRCFIHDTVECGADCAAYVTAPRMASAMELSQEQAHCALLLGMDRVGRSLTILASIASERRAKEDNREADAIRASQLERRPVR